MDKNYIYIREKKFERIENKDGSETLIHISKSGIKTTINFTNDINKHNESIKAIGEFYVKAGL